MIEHPLRIFEGQGSCQKKGNILVTMKSFISTVNETRKFLTKANTRSL